jgi:cell division septation protein DedD
VAPAAGTAHSPPSDETGTAGQAADASSAPPSAGESSADQGSVPAAVAESPAAPEEPAGDGAGARPEGGETAPGAAAAPPASYAPPTSGPLLAYSLHVGSYQSFEGAQRAASALRAKGLVAYVAPVLLEGKGEWYRVFAGLHPDAPASQESLAGALKSGAVSEGAVRETPWALYLGTFASPELAAELIARLAKSGVSGYAVGTGPVLVYAGAFESAGDAEILNRQLRDRGFEAALVRRRGVEAR